VALAALLLFVAGRCLVPMDETDLFFNLRLGEIVLRTHRVPLNNLLSFTWPEARDVNLAWLFQVLLALVHRAGGVPATVLLKTALVLATFAVLWRVGRRRGAAPSVLAPMLALSAWAAEPRFVERPHLVTFLGLALVLLALERAEDGRPRALWALLPGGLVWANGNSCFFLAPVVLLLYAAGARADGRTGEARRAALLALALAPLVLATPSGTGALGYIANHFRMPSLRPLQEYRTAAWPVDGPFFFLMAALAAAIALAPRGRWRTFLPAVALGLLGARRIRFVAEAALLTGPAVAAALSARLGSARALTLTAHPAAGLVAAGALILLALAPHAADARAGRTWLDLEIERGLVPEAAIRFAERQGLRERMYNDLEVGSYLTWDGWPRYRVFQDPRINGYPPEFHAVLRRADLTRAEWQALLDRFTVTAALITYPAVNPRAALFDPALWALVYRDSEALIFARRGPEHDAGIRRWELPLTFHYAAATGLRTAPLAEPPAASPVDPRCWQARLGDYYVERAASAPAPAREAYRAGLSCLRSEQRATLAALELQVGDAAASARLWHELSGREARVREGYALLRLGRAAEALAGFEVALGRNAEGRGSATDPLSLALSLADDADGGEGTGAGKDGGEGTGGGKDGGEGTGGAAETDADALLGRALALEALHRDPEAQASLRAFLRRAPDHVAAGDARARLARLSSRAAP
jgi:tetratricopeptide (TPR) repeat protein